MVNMLGQNRGAEDKPQEKSFQDAIQTPEGLMNMTRFC